LKDDGRAAVRVIAISAGITAVSFNVWYPFIPLYAIELGAKSDADAVFWAALAISVQGMARLASSAVWGIASDRFGRKLMLLRALYFATLTFSIAAFASEPWHLAIALGCQGFFSGFIPASIALTSVTVPDSRMTASLAMVTGAQHLGSTFGPVVGAVLALALGYRESIAVAAMLPLISATAVLLLVPRDEVAPRRESVDGRQTMEPFRMSAQFLLAILALFAVHSMNELVRVATPIALRIIGGDEGAAGRAGLAFSLAGLTSAACVLVLSPWYFRKLALRTAFGAACALGAGGFVLLALAGSVGVYITGFLVVAGVVSVMVPAMNSHLATSVNRARRGTAFGVAASVQAFSFAIGPLGAALFAATSLTLGFGILVAIFLIIGLLLTLLTRAPTPALSASD
jgi:DHA1 family multidrug resistance protein-like MFS transporter